jgi:hypothetical protein
MSELCTGIVDRFAETYRRTGKTFGFVIVNDTSERIYFELNDGRERDTSGTFTGKREDTLPLKGDTITFRIGHNEKGKIAQPWAFVTKVDGPRETRPIIRERTRRVS